jgi:hypothetical protein
MSNNTVSMPNNTVSMPNNTVSIQPNNTISNEGIDMMASIGRGRSAMSLFVSYIVCGICMFIGIGMIIVGSIHFIRNFNNCSTEQNDLNDLNNFTKKSTEQNKPKCIEKKALFILFGVGLFIILFGILFVYLAKWNRTLVKNNPTVAAFQGMSMFFPGSNRYRGGRSSISF